MTQHRIKTNAATIVANKKQRANITFVYQGNGKSYHVYNGERVQPLQLDMMLPIIPKKQITYL